MTNELPIDFPHDAPNGYSYEVEKHNASTVSIWLLHSRRYIFHGSDKTVRTIWGYYKPKSRNKHAGSASITLRELRNLQPGDFITHIDHGIGKFAGLESMYVKGVKQEVLRIVYRDNDLLYVSVNSLHKISKYTGKEGTLPKLHKLGSGSWEKQKRTTKKKVKDIARDLINLYAKRKQEKGFAFAEDNYLQLELEASFFYEDTPDQFDIVYERDKFKVVVSP